MARSAERIWPLEDGVQPLRPLGEDREVDAAIRGGTRRRRSRVVQHRLDNQPRAPAFCGRKRGAAPPLVKRVRPRCLLADKAYDTNPFRAVLEAGACVAVIPSMGNRVHAFDYDKDLYKARSAVECTFNLLKQARRFATRYEKTARNYAPVVALGCALLWL